MQSWRIARSGDSKGWATVALVVSGLETAALVLLLGRCIARVGF
jgi:hypothetical protein